MDIISIEGMEFHAFIGCFEEEKIIGTRFLVDLYLSINAEKAMQSDELKDTVNYQAVYLLIKEQMNKKMNLLEHAMLNIQNAVLQKFPEIISLRCKIRKMNPPLGGQIGSVTFESQKMH